MVCIIPYPFGFHGSPLFFVSGNKMVEIQHADVELMVYCCTFKTSNDLLLFLSRYPGVSREHKKLQSPSYCRSQCESHIKVSAAHPCIIAVQT